MYGIRLRNDDRHVMVDRDQSLVVVRLKGRRGKLKVRVTPSYWRTCPELRHHEIGRWLKDLGLAPWPKGHPPRLLVSRRGGKDELYVEPA